MKQKIRENTQQQLKSLFVQFLKLFLQFRTTTFIGYIGAFLVEYKQF